MGCKSQLTEKSTKTKNKNIDTALENYVKASTEKENAFARRQTDDNGELITTISFEVKTNDKNFDNGIIPWVSIEKPEKDLIKLVNKNKIVIVDTAITILIDYPLTNKYEFKLMSKNGFTREQLLMEISKNYKKIYKEEEETATIKTLPMNKRKMINRNQTNGKYGIWGHDISDLDLSDITVYRTVENKIVLMLGIES